MSSRRKWSPISESWCPLLGPDRPLALGRRGLPSTSRTEGGLPVGKNWLRQRNDLAFLCSFTPSISHHLFHVHFSSVPPVRSFNLVLALPGLGGARESETSRAVLSAGCGSSENPLATAPVPRSWASRRDLRRTVGHPVQTVNTSGYHVFWPWGRALFPSIQGSATLHLKASPSSPPFPSHPHSPVL